MTRLRQGRRVGRTLYEQQGPEPAGTDPVVGLVDTTELAAEIVEAVNARRAADELARQTWTDLHRGTIPSDHEESP